MGVLHEATEEQNYYASKVHVHYESGHFTPCAGSVTEETYLVKKEN
jgi:hypothetical protein